MCMERRHAPPGQIDALDSLSNFKIAFHQCVGSYFSLSCGAELIYVLVLLEEFLRFTRFTSVFIIYFLLRTRPFFFFVYLNEIGKEVLRACNYSAKATAFGCCYPSLAEGICCAVGYDPPK